MDGLGAPTSVEEAFAQEVNGVKLIGQDVAILDLPVSGKFFRSTSAPGRQPGGLSSDEDISDSSLPDSLHDSDDAGLLSDSIRTPSTSQYRMRPQPPHPPVPPLPRLSRALTIPLPSQLGHLRHPHRPPSAQEPHRQVNSEPNTAGGSQFRQFSLELADSVQMVIQTMLQISPPHLFDPAKEQVSACSLSIPTPSMSAMFTAMKNLNYISANLSTFCEEGAEPTTPHPIPFNEFDIGEMLQNVGDALSGAAAQAGVEIVLFHGDVALRHITVNGDESGTSYLLAHVIRQVLATAERGDSIEIGLDVLSGPSRQQEGQPSDSMDGPSPSPGDFESTHCTIEIRHKFCAPRKPWSAEEVPFRLRPALSTLLLRRLLCKVGADIKTLPSTPGELAVVLTFNFRGSPEYVTPAASKSDLGDDDQRSVSEPTLDELSSFAESLKGKKVTLYASPQGSFARHLTGYLTAWGMDVSHVSGEDDLTDQPEPASTGTTSSPVLDIRQQDANAVPFIFIDDDVDVLKERLNELRFDYAGSAVMRKRPSLAPRTRSSPQIPRARGYSTAASPVVIVHFASLANFKIVRDVMQNVVASFTSAFTPIPEVMIIPKPAGPRRLLTTLHTALTKPAVDPFFSPIATSPSTPGSHHGGSYMSSTNSPKPAQRTTRPANRSRTNSDRSIVSTSKDVLEPIPPSPLARAESSEYFSESALGSTPSSGYVLQSPEGKPTGIFFHPTPKFGAQRTPSGGGHVMERDKGQFAMAVNRPMRIPSSSSEPNGLTFSSLHENGETAKTPPAKQYARSGSSSFQGRPTIQTQFGSDEGSAGRRPSLTLAKRLSTSPTVMSPDSVLPRPPSQASLSRQTTVKAKPTNPPGKKGKDGGENIVPPISVLIVDDNPINQTVLSTFMKKKKIKFDVAKDGQEAVDKWCSGEFHLILMDIQMPVMDGIEATKEIRRIEKINSVSGSTPRTPSCNGSPPPTYLPLDAADNKPTASPYRSSVIIVALTASALQSDRVAALAAGCNDFLTKPVSLVWLNNKIIEWGSIKALQMWADPQKVQARSVAERLHVPKDRTIRPHPADISRSESPASSNIGVALPLNGKDSSRLPHTADGLNPTSASSSSFWSPTQPSPPDSWGRMNGNLNSGQEKIMPLNQAPDTPFKDPAPDKVVETPSDSEPGESIPGHLPGSGHGDDIDSVQ